ncbi:MAG: VWA domain-containing protein [Deltaproteobacteria bacterium]|nr:VWA domain-containing protein [Deltaproteobacteria bacterium]
MSHDHERPVEPFSDLHVEHGVVKATLLHDPTVEGLDMAIYMDGSGSMQEEYENKKKVSGGGIIGWLFGKPRTEEVLPNQVEPQVQWMLEYLATKDRNGLLRVAYWACGSGRDVEVIGELKGVDVKGYKVPGPKRMGNRTVLTPALKDYVGYFKQQVAQGARRGCAVIVTDGQIHDADEVKAYSKELAGQMARGQLPRINFILVGVGDGVDEKQLEDICHEEYKGVGHLWCHRIAAEIKQVAELVAVLVDETMTVAAGGTVFDDKGKVVKIYEGRLPAVLEFSVPEGAKSFTLEVGGQRYTQPLPGEEDHDDDDDDDHH